jgi:hypothetical protein
MFIRLTRAATATAAPTTAQYIFGKSSNGGIPLPMDIEPMLMSIPLMLISILTAVEEKGEGKAVRYKR